MKLTLNTASISFISAFMVLLATYTFLGFTGVRTLVGMFFIFILPTYLILKNMPTRVRTPVNPGKV